MVGLKNKILITLVTLFALTKVQSQTSDPATALVALSTKSSVLAEFTVPGHKDKHMIYGGGVSFFFNKGNKGKDYTGFITNYSSVYETFYAKSGSIYMLVGNKITPRIAWIMKFGMGVTTRYLNGKGVGNLPNELWYTRQKGYNDFIGGAMIQFSSDISCIRIGWDSFNSFNLGIGVHLNKKK